MPSGGPSSPARRREPERRRNVQLRRGGGEEEEREMTGGCLTTTRCVALIGDSRGHRSVRRAGRGLSTTVTMMNCIFCMGEGSTVDDRRREKGRREARGLTRESHPKGAKSNATSRQQHTHPNTREGEKESRTGKQGKVMDSSEQSWPAGEGEGWGKEGGERRASSSSRGERERWLVRRERQVDATSGQAAAARQERRRDARLAGAAFMPLHLPMRGVRSSSQPSLSFIGSRPYKRRPAGAAKALSPREDQDSRGSRCGKVYSIY